MQLEGLRIQEAGKEVEEAAVLRRGGKEKKVEEKLVGSPLPSRFTHAYTVVPS